MRREKFYSLLLELYKPGRYIGEEINRFKKRYVKEKVKIVLAFPDLYEIGMSHIGLNILYYILNQRKDVVAERVYMPDLDLISYLEKEKILLFSLESKIPLNRFDILGFTLQYELSYTNVLAMLKLSRIPLLSKDRDENSPIVIAGGPCASNPEPLAEFIDLFCIGEGEELIVELVEAYKKYRELNREELIREFGKIRGIYVPSLYEVKNKKNYHLSPKYPDVPSKIRKRIVKDLDRAIYPTSQLVPLVESVHDRGVLEIERGCTQGCRFCHSGMISRPKRSKSNSTIIRLAKDIVKNTGCREISLLSLNVTDFCGGVELLKDLIEVFKEDKIAISFPSMRINKKLLDLAKISSLIKKSGITIALEAGSDRLRRIINKKLIKEEMEELIKDVFEMGYQLIKLYFMIGLPTEKKEDILEIVNLIKKIRSFKKAKKVRVSISSFIPKPHTPFQWLGQEEPSKIREKQKILIENIKDKNVLLSWHQVEQSLLEAALARGDRRLSSVIKRAYEYGCIFDSWSERFNFRLWEKAFRDEGLDLTFYACRSFSLEESLPWDHIDMGIKKSFLKREYEKAFKGLESNDCEKGECLNCGACEKKKEEREKEEIRLEKVRRRKEEIKKDIYRVRFKYHKIDTMSFLSHLDITRLIKQSLIMAELPVIVKGGFNPQIKISFGKALPLGVESICEYFDLFLWKKIDLNKAIKRVNTKLPSGLKILEGEYTSLKEESVFSSFNTGIFKLKVKIKRDIDVIRSEIENKLEKEKIYLERKRREIEIKEMIKSIEIEPVEEEIALINMVLKNSLNPKNIMDILTKDVEIMNIRCVGYFKLIE